MLEQSCHVCKLAAKVSPENPAPGSRPGAPSWADGGSASSPPGPLSLPAWRAAEDCIGGQVALEDCWRCIGTLPPLPKPNCFGDGLGQLWGQADRSALACRGR